MTSPPSKWGGPPTGSPSGTVPFHVNTASLPPEQPSALSLIFASANAWETATGGNLDMEYGGGTSMKIALGDGLNVLYFPTASEWPGGPGDGVLGVTSLSFFGAGEISEADVMLSPFVDWSSTSGFMGVTAHELGHFLGLAHVPSTAALMYPAHVGLTGPAADDIAGAKALYGTGPGGDGVGTAAPGGTSGGGLPNLKITSFSYEPIGATVTFHVGLQNDGAVATSSDATVPGGPYPDFYVAIFQGDGTPEGTTLVTYELTLHLGPGASTTVDLVWGDGTPPEEPAVTLPTTAWATVDAVGEITESSEEDNAAGPLSVSAAGSGAAPAPSSPSPPSAGGSSPPSGGTGPPSSLPTAGSPSPTASSPVAKGHDGKGGRGRHDSCFVEVEADAWSISLGALAALGLAFVLVGLLGQKRRARQS